MSAIASYEPSWTHFTFSAPDGTQYKFDSSGNLSQRIDRNGNKLAYSSSGITYSHASVPGSTKQVTFSRASGRITEIKDPVAIAGSGLPVLKYSYDTSGNLTNVARLIDRAGSGTYENTDFKYDSGTQPSLITRVIDARGITTVSNLYDNNGRLLRQYDALNNSTEFAYEDNGRRQVITDKNQDTSWQEFTEAGQVASVKDGENAVTTYQYDANGRRLAEISPVGGTNRYAYNDRDELIGVTNELNYSSSATYDNYGQPLVVVDALGYGTTNAYDSKGNLATVTNALVIVSRYGYDAQGNRKAETNAFGRAEQTITLYAYDAFGNLTNVTDALGNQTGHTYDLNGNRLTERRERTLASGSKQTLLTTSVYDAANRVISVVEPDSFTNRTAYNAIGKVAFTTNKLGVVTHYDYDARGLLTNTVFALGTAQEVNEQNYYDPEGRRTNSVDRAGRETSYAYDGVGRLRRTTFPDDTYTENQYDTAGRLRSTGQGPRNASVMNPPPSALTTRYEYDAAGRRVAVINALNQTNYFGYDNNGNQTSFADHLGRTNSYAFDRLNRQVKLTYPDNTPENYGYDGLNRRVALTNQANIVSRFGYDKLGRLTAVTNGWGTGTSNWVTYAYDEVGNQTNQVDALNRMTKFEYDSMGRRTKVTLPGTQSELFAYDNVGNQVRHTNFNSVVITNAYDNLNRLTSRTSVGGYHIAYTYSDTGQQLTRSDASGNYAFDYDSRDRLLTNTGPAGTLVYTYDIYGRLESIESQRAGGASMTYQYDSLNRLTNVIDAVAGNTLYGFDDVGNLQSVRYPNAVTNTYTYDALNRLTNLVTKNSGGTLASFAYKLAAAGNRTNLTETVNGQSRTFGWSYDVQYRLTNEVITGTAPTGTIGYSYDAVGNRLSRASTVSGITNQSFTYNSNDRLNGDTYDNNGSTTASAGNSYAYDVDGRLTNFNSGSAVFSYGANGIRVSKTVGGTITLYLVDDRNPTGYAQVLEELSVSGGATNLAKVFTYGLDLIAQRDASTGARSFFGYDGNGNTRFLSDTNGSVTDTYIYDAFGTLLASAGSTVNVYRFNGEQLDSDLSLYYLRARYLNAGVGRFWTRDTFVGQSEDPASLHRYLFCGDNPINCIDPNGNFSITISIGTLEITGKQLATATVVIAATLYSGSYVYRHLVRPAYLQHISQPLADADRNGIVQQLRTYQTVNPKFPLLINAIENDLVTVRVVPGTGGSHNRVSRGTLFIPQVSLDQQDNNLAAALFVFGEFQHDALSNDQLGERAAQAEFEQVKEAIRNVNPGAITPYVDGLIHGGH